MLYEGAPCLISQLKISCYLSLKSIVAYKPREMCTIEAFKQTFFFFWGMYVIYNLVTAYFTDVINTTGKSHIVTILCMSLL